MSIMKHQGDEFKAFYNELENLVSTNFKSTGRKISSTYPLVDIFEESQTFRLKADLPGLNKEDFEVSIEDNVLTISGEKKESVFSGKGQYSHFERNYGQFNRSFNLPSNINNDSIEAFYKDGVLDIIISKKHIPTDALIIDSE